MKRRTNESVLYGLYDRPDELEKAFQLLLDAQIPVENISLLMNEDVHDRDFKALDRTYTGRGAAVGSVIGGALGGLIGGLSILGSLTGIGVMVVGPMLALAASGGLLGALIGHGVPEEEAKRLHDALHEGKVMIAVHSEDAEEIRRVIKILTRNHGELIDISKPRDPTWTGL